MEKTLLWEVSIFEFVLVTVILGGGAVRKWAVTRWGVDAATNDAMEGVRIIMAWLEERR